jgi:hypothetical protein
LPRTLSMALKIVLPKKTKDNVKAIVEETQPAAN